MANVPYVVRKERFIAKHGKTPYQHRIEGHKGENLSTSAKRGHARPKYGEQSITQRGLTAPRYRYSATDIDVLANRPKSELTSYQRQLVKEQGRTISAKEIATKTGIPESEINKRIQWYDVWSNRPVLGVDPGSIRFRRGEGYVARSTTGKKLVFYIVRTGNGQTGYFGSVADIQKLADNIDKAIYPELVGAEIIIPGRNG